MTAWKSDAPDALNAPNMTGTHNEGPDAGAYSADPGMLRLGTANALDVWIRPVASGRRAVAVIAVIAVLAALYRWGWGDGIVAAIRALTADSGANTSGTVTVAGQMRRLGNHVLLTAAAAAAFCAVRRLTCGFAFVRPRPHERRAGGGAAAGSGTRPRAGFRFRPIPVRKPGETLRRWWDAGFAYVFCMLAGFAAIDVASALLRTTFHSYPFGTRYESGAAAALYLVNMFFAGPTEELVLLGFTVTALRWVGAPWWLVTCVAVGLRVPFHLYYGWAAFAIAVWPVLAVMLYRRVGMITPMIVAHGMYDVATAMTSLTAVAGSSWPLVASGAIVATPVIWAATIAWRWLAVRRRCRAERRQDAKP